MKQRHSCQNFTKKIILRSSFIFSAFLALFLISNSIAKISLVNKSIANLPTPNSRFNSSLVGSLSGKLTVNASGAAIYSIPISVSPGTADMEPMLSLNYDSQQSNGIVGVGFTLQGVTSITRCPSNLSQNDNIHGVDYSDQDRFCFNGQQLIAVKGNYGADGTEYRTYEDGRTKIISYGRQGNGPARFKIWSKGGQVAEYGFTWDSQVYAQGKSSVAIWALDKISDTSGNYIQVKYSKDDNNGSFYLAEIDYTGNEAAQLDPYNSVKFSYTDRPDKIEAYNAGSVTRITKRLGEIQSFSGRQLVYDYKLNYRTPSLNTGVSRLDGIQECDGNGNCLPETVFTWQTTQSPNWQEASNYAPPTDFVDASDSPITYNEGGRFVDLNNDGLEDLVSGPGERGKINAWLNTGSGWQASASYTPPVPIITYQADKGVRFFDVNGDNLPDLVQADGSGWPTLKQNIWLNSGSGWQFSSAYKVPSGFAFSIPNGFYPAIVYGTALDFNGDNLVDLTQPVSGQTISNVWLRNLSSGWNIATNYQIPFCDDKGSFAWLDLNGDSLIDMARSTSDTSQNGAWLNTGSGWQKANNFLLPVTLSSARDLGVRFIDLNGDGLLDIIQNEQHDGVHSQGAWLNTGSGWQWAQNYVPPFLISTEYQDNGVRLVDLNGDGLTDIVQSSTNSSPMVWLNNGNGWLYINNYLPPTPIVNEKGSDLGVRFIDVNGDGLVDMLRGMYDGSKVYSNAWLNSQKKPDLLLKIVDGFGDSIDLNYKALTDKNIYNRDTNGLYPNVDVQTPLYVVSQTTSGAVSNDPQTQAKANGQHITYYVYKGAKYNQQGLGFLGFRQIISTDASSGLSKITTYSQDTDRHIDGEIITEETRLKDGTLITATQNTWDVKIFGSGTFNQTYYLPYTKETVTKNYDLHGNLITTKTSDFNIDDYGNLTQIVSQIQDTNSTYSTTTVNIYANDADKWLIGQLLASNVTAAINGKSNPTRHSSFNYDVSTGLLLQSIVEPDDPQYRLVTSYQRDLFGNIIKTTVAGRYIDDRITKQSYDSEGRFVIQSSDALGHITQQNYDPRFGTPLQAIDANGLLTNYQYDSLGRLITTSYPNGSKSNVTYNWCQGPNGAVYAISKFKTDSPTVTEYFDSLERRVALKKQGLNSEDIWETTFYDDLGRVTKKSLPYFATQNPQYLQMDYDVLGRPIKTTYPNLSTSSIDYQGLTTVFTNELGQKTTKVVNARGDLVTVIDNLQHKTSYGYDALSDLTTITDSAGNVTKLTYDNYGHRLTINDPDKGKLTYRYDVLGQMVAQIDALKQATVFQYDKLGRMVERIDNGGISAWTYDTAEHGIGKLAKITGVAGTKGSPATAKEILQAARENLVNYTRAYSYDELSRPTQVTTTINSQDYVSNYAYDKDSRLSLQTYPSGFRVKNNYNKLGFLVSITNADDGRLYWQLNTQDAAGHITSETRSNGLITTYCYDPQTEKLLNINTTLNSALALQKNLFPAVTGQKIKDNARKETPDEENLTSQEVKNSPTLIQNLNYSYDKMGNLISRNDVVNNSEEKFQYDGLNRLTQSQIGNSDPLGYEYDDIGNIVYRSDVGYYFYNSPTKKIRNKEGSFQDINAGPHAVITIGDTHVASYQYNANGDQITGQIDGKERDITYTTYGKPKAILTDQAETDFYYNADRESFERIDKANGKTTTTLSLGNYEIVSVDDGKNIVTQLKHYIGADTLYVQSSDQQNNVYELLKDNLGSVVDITDANANVVQHFYYSVFGEQKQTKGKAIDNPVTHHGYTDHEEVEAFNLVHMGGRIYDPMIGRFLTADPFVQAADNPQDLNRYSYCVNNPLLYTDPNGFSFFKAIWDAVCDVADFVWDTICDVADFIYDVFRSEAFQTILQIAAGVLSLQYGGFWCLAPIVCSAGETALAGGNFAEVLKSAACTFLSMVSWTVTGDLLSDAGLLIRGVGHGVVGGALETIQGGNFKDGFLAAAVAEVNSGFINSIDQDSFSNISLMKRASAAALLGGTKAALTGGNFWGGAETAAFAQLFNNEIHRKKVLECLAREKEKYLNSEGKLCIKQTMAITAYDDKGAGSDWAYFDRDPKAVKSLEVGDVAVANTNPKPYAYGSTVKIFDDSGKLIYAGAVHETGAGWDAKHQNVQPDRWLDIWFKDEKRCNSWGVKCLNTEICAP